jgi:hypothetical protein
MKRTIYIFTFFILFASFDADAQCAMCRAVLESEEDGQSAEAINNGIVYLMIFPYLLIGGVGYLIYRMRRQARLKGE